VTSAEVPFMNSYWPKWEVPVATSFGGADISWLVGFVVAGGLYYLANHANATPRRAAPSPEVTRESEGTSA
jgi:hypothetical protein